MPPLDLATIDQTSQPFLGEWHRLVSTTNWEKGKIILAWRQALIAADADVTEYSDEAWSQRVGHVSPQHVGRLRRTYERFGEVCATYQGLYWSHFQMALDWHDAEMWLEGAVQNGWSVAEMRGARWQALGAPDELKPRDADVITAELDEDAGPHDNPRLPATIEPTISTVAGPHEFPSAKEDGEPWDSDEPAPRTKQFRGSTEEPDAAATAAQPPVRPFAELPSLPSDVADAFESFKLCIIRHRMDDWQEISQADMLATLDALKELALAPPVSTE
jgi:hypothetical protein